VAKFCKARALELTEKIPAPRRNRAPVNVRIAAAILRDPQGRVLLVRDPGAHDGVLFSRMWQFPAVEVAAVQAAGDAAQALSAHVARTLGVAVPAWEELPAARHGVTYRNVALLPFLARVAELPNVARSRALPLARLGSVPVSSATRKIAAALNKITRR
jgi:adenine-specific DNA glycosylase